MSLSALLEKVGTTQLLPVQRELDSNSGWAILQGSRSGTVCGQKMGVATLVRGARAVSSSFLRPSGSSFASPGRQRATYTPINGVLCHIGTAGGTRTYQNPHSAGDVVATMSHKAGCGCSPGFVQHKNDAAANQTDNFPSAWMAVDLKAARLVPSHYTLRHGRNNGAYVLRHWELQASDDSDNWTILQRHSNDESLVQQAYSVATWPLDASTVAGRSFRHFRILQTGKNTKGDHRLTCAGIELYGLLQAA